MSLEKILETKTWNEKIRFYRQLYGYTQDQLADIIGTTQKQVYNWEHAMVIPNRISQKAIARAFNTKENPITEKTIFGEIAS